MVELTLDGVTRTYEGTTALDGVSLDVRDGEFFTLVGPSGCGKTTTLRLVAGFEEPTAGRVAFGDRNMRGVPPEDRNVGVVFQNYALFPHLSVGENVAYGLRFRDPPGGESDDERVASLLDLVDLGGMEERDPATLSGGQQQRVALARALAPGPRLLLLDEPMSALDAQLRERLRLQVKAVQSKLDITTVYVTHDQAEALAVSDRVAVMRSGRVEQVGTPQRVYREPATRFVAEFVGDNTVFEGEVVDRSNAGRETEGFVADVGGTRFHLAGDARTGQRVTFCVRPGRFRVDAGENRFTAAVTGTEFLGETTRVHLEWRGRPVPLRTSGAPPTVEEVTVGFDPADAHVVALE